MPSNPASLDTGLNPAALYSAAITLCDQRRAFLLVDPAAVPSPSVTAAVDWKSSGLGITDANGAAFWPRLRLPDPLNKNNLRTFAPSGVVAGVYATTDGSRGVWKAPAGINATLNGVQSMTYQLTDPENGLLNPLGLNCLRTFPVYGSVRVGCPHAGRRGRAGQPVEVRPGAANGALPGGKPVPRHSNGRCSSRTTSRCGPRSAST